MAEQPSLIVMDNGSHTTKVGFAGKTAPTEMFKTVVGRPNKDVYVGPEMCHPGTGFDRSFPIEAGIVKNWDDMQKIWQFTFDNVLKVNAAEHPVLLTENPSKANAEKMSQIMFETFSVPSLYIAVQSSLALFGTGRMNGVVLDIGHGKTYACPLLDGFPVAGALVSGEVTGARISGYLKKLLDAKGVNDVCACEVKGKGCYVALDFNEEMKKPETTVEIKVPPRGRMIQLGSERFQATELLFQPSLNDVSGASVSQLIFDAIQKCDAGKHAVLFENIVLSGGSAMFKGIASRVEAEMKKLAPQAKIAVQGAETNADGVIRPWIGASILGALPAFAGMAVTAEEYKSEGFAAVQRKCLANV